RLLEAASDFGSRLALRGFGVLGALRRDVVDDLRRGDANNHPRLGGAYGPRHAVVRLRQLVDQLDAALFRHRHGSPDLGVGVRVLWVVRAQADLRIALHVARLQPAPDRREQDVVAVQAYPDDAGLRRTGRADGAQDREDRRLEEAASAVAQLDRHVAQPNR